MISDVPQFQQKQPEQETFLAELLTALSYRSDELSHYLHKIACGINQLLDSDWSIVTVCWDGAREVVASSVDSDEEHSKEYSEFSMHETLSRQVMQTGQSLAIENVQLYSKEYNTSNDYCSYFCVPLRTIDRTFIGTICSLFCQPRRFTPEAIQLAETFAERTAIVIDNYRLYQQQQQRIQALEAEIKQRQQTEQKLAHLAEIGELAAMIVHEIRNPLTTVLLGLTVFRDINLSERSQQRLTLALEEAERLKRLLNEILMYTKHQVLQTSKLEMNQLMTSLLDSLCNIPAATGRSIQFVSSLPLAHIEGDRDKLKQVLINLTRNACEAIGEGENVTWRINPGKTVNQVCVSVHNDGDPISGEILLKIGTPFFTNKPTGNGLGLAIVKKIVEAHRGELVVESTMETGTTVSIYLPLVRSTVIKDVDS